MWIARTWIARLKITRTWTTRMEMTKSFEENESQLWKRLLHLIRFSMLRSLFNLNIEILNVLKLFQCQSDRHCATGRQHAARSMPSPSCSRLLVEQTRIDRTVEAELFKPNYWSRTVRAELIELNCLSRTVWAELFEQRHSLGSFVCQTSNTHWNALHCSNICGTPRETSFETLFETAFETLGGTSFETQQGTSCEILWDLIKSVQ